MMSPMLPNVNAADILCYRSCLYVYLAWRNRIIPVVITRNNLTEVARSKGRNITAPQRYLDREENIRALPLHRTLKSGKSGADFLLENICSEAGFEVYCTSGLYLYCIGRLGTRCGSPPIPRAAIRIRQDRIGVPALPSSCHFGAENPTCHKHFMVLRLNARRCKRPGDFPTRPGLQSLR